MPKLTVFADDDAKFIISLPSGKIRLMIDGKLVHEEIMPKIEDLKP